MSDVTTMSHRGLGSEAFGGTPVGNRVAVPAGAREPITVYINGVEQTRAEDYEIADGEIVFRQPIYKEDLHEIDWVPRFGRGLGRFGWYDPNESVDILFQSSAGIRLVSDVPILPAE